MKAVVRRVRPQVGQSARGRGHRNCIGSAPFQPSFHLNTESAQICPEYGPPAAALSHVIVCFAQVFGIRTSEKPHWSRPAAALIASALSQPSPYRLQAARFAPKRGVIGAK